MTGEHILNIIVNTMKKLNYIRVVSFLTIVFGMIVSCQNDFVTQDSQTINEGSEVKQVVTTIPNLKFVEDSSLLTRSSIIIESDQEMQLVWAANDTIGIFPNKGFQVAFPMEDGAGTKSAIFNGGGWGLKSDYTYSAYYPLIGEFYLDKTKIPIVLSDQIQKGNGSYSHIEKKDYMMASNSIVDVNGGVNFNFQHLISILHVQVRMPKSGKYTTALLETTGKFITEAKLDLTNGSLTPTVETAVQLLKLDNVETLDEGDTHVLDLYVNIIPVDLSGNNLYMKIFDEQGTCYSITLKTYNFEAGSFYHYRKIASNAECSSLPVVLLSTENGQRIIDKDTWLDNTTITILNTDGTVLDAPGKVKGRGNATWNYAKKPYAIKYSKKQSPFGFPENKSWVLLAEYNDRSLLRTAYMCAISKAAGMDYTINYKHVNLYINGDYKGIYLLTDKVEAGKNRVKVENDGYLIEDDSYYANEKVYFVTDILHKGFSFKYPDDDGDIVEGDDNYIYIKDFMNGVEQSLILLNLEPNDEEYLDYININSFARFYVASELLATYDPNRYYTLTSKSSKLKMMPMWDAEWSMGLWPTKAWAGLPASMSTNKIWEKKHYFPYLFKSNKFKNEIKSEWDKLKTKISQIKQEVSSTANIISTAQVYNFEKWPDTGQVLNVQFDTWEEEVNYINQFFDDRASWLDEYISSWE